MGKKEKKKKGGENRSSICIHPRHLGTQGGEGVDKGGTGRNKGKQGEVSPFHLCPVIVIATNKEGGDKGREEKKKKGRRKEPALAYSF